MGDRRPSLHTLNQMQTKYEFMEEIGGGSVRLIYKARKLSTLQIVAITLVRCPEDGDTIFLSEYIALENKLLHGNIIRMLEIDKIRNYVSLVFEYLDFDLIIYMTQHTFEAGDQQRIKKFLYQILSGVAYYHSKKIILRDLKPANLLIDTCKYVVKIADFGLARAIGFPINSCTTKVVNTGYMAPEQSSDIREYSTPVDMWSVGVIFAEMVKQRNVLRGVTLDQLSKLFSTISPPDETWRGVDPLAKELQGLEPSGVDLRAKILHLNPDEKITAEDALNPLPHLESARVDLLYKMLCLNADERITTLDAIDPLPRLEPAGVDLLSRMLRLKPHERITAEDALKHDYFRDVRNEFQFYRQNWLPT